MDPAINLKPLDIAALLCEYHLHPKKKLGQNFLVDPAALKRVVAAAELDPEDVVLEIGPGLGSLTRYLSLATRKVIAVELDQALIPPLQAVLKAFNNNVTILQGNILDLEPGFLIGSGEYKVVANIPYYITSTVIRHLLDVKPANNGPRWNNQGYIGSEPILKKVVLTVQKEVAQRICAETGEMNLLAISVQVFGKAYVAASIPAGAFYPSPEVDSSVIVIDVFPKPLIPSEYLDRYFALAHAGFSQKRKKLRNALGAGMHLSTDKAEEMLLSVGIDPGRRAETLSLQEWSALTLWGK